MNSISIDRISFRSICAKEILFLEWILYFAVGFWASEVPVQPSNFNVTRD